MCASVSRACARVIVFLPTPILPLPLPPPFLVRPPTVQLGDACFASPVGKLKINGQDHTVQPLPAGFFRDVTSRVTIRPGNARVRVSAEALFRDQVSTQEKSDMLRFACVRIIPVELPKPAGGGSAAAAAAGGGGESKTADMSEREQKRQRGIAMIEKAKARALARRQREAAASASAAQPKEEEEEEQKELPPPPALTQLQREKSAEAGRDLIARALDAAPDKDTGGGKEEGGGEEQQQQQQQPAPEAPPPPGPDYAGMKTLELRRLCKERKLNHKGSRDDLIGRLSAISL